MKKCSFILILIFLINISAYSQLIFNSDTLNIGEVKVKSVKPDGAGGYKLQSIDARLINTFTGSSLAALLENSSSLYIKNYGAGGLASSSFRGMGANHTEILWEGQKINSPMLGSSDFNTIPVFFVDKVDIYYGGSPQSFGNRGPGGTVSLAGKANWNKGFRLEYIQDLGSFSLFGEGLKADYSAKNIHYKIKAFAKSALNDFKYYKYGDSGESDYRKDSEEFSRGVLQELYFKRKNSVISAKLWYNNIDRNLPGGINVAQQTGNEKQYDESLRANLRWQLYKERFKLDINSSYISDWLVYTNRLLSLDSRNKSDRYSASILMEYSLDNGYKLSGGIRTVNTIVSSNNYAELIKRSKQSIDLLVSKTYMEQLALLASISQLVLDAKLLPLQSSIGFDYKLLKEKNFRISGSLGKSLLLPTLNDLHWMPGGNPDLQTENSFNSELSFKAEFNPASKSLINTELTAFRSGIHDMIVWQPVNSSVWQPDNISNVVSKGVEMNIMYLCKYANSDMKLNLSYSYTDARKTNSLLENDMSQNKQLIYVPRHSGSARFEYSYKRINTAWWVDYTGVRYITSDNSNSLPPYLLNNCSLSLSPGLGKFKISPAFTINNIFARSYTNIIAYPMPMRSFRFTLNIIFESR